MKKLFALLHLIITFTCLSQGNNVLFGERDLSDPKLALYYDREGSPYPDFRISNQILSSSDSSLRKFYQSNANDFKEITKLYNCPFDTYSDDNLKTLNKIILQRIQKKINADPLSSSSVTFLIHGFRKPFLPTGVNGEYTSSQDYISMKENMAKFYPGAMCTVEIYWDGLYGCCFSASASNNEPLFLLFQKAQAENAVNVGKSIKTFLAGQSTQRVNIITHSLGAKVAAYALFNCDGEEEPTPSNNQVNIYMIAPAISGDLIFDNYYKRNSNIDFRKNDNYNLKVVYNEKDFVLRKKDNKVGLFGPGPEKYGYTTLGCNHKNEAEKLLSKFKGKIPGSPISIYDLTSVHKCHLVVCYFKYNNLQMVFSDLK